VKKRLFFLAVALLIFGAVRLPVESRLQGEQQAVFFRSTVVDIGLREQAGQLGFLAALGGFRSLVASLLWIQAHTAWESTEWGRMAALFETIFILQPRSLIYWDMASWHMAWNAAAAARDNPDQPSEALRRRAERQYQELGRDMLERGLRNNPDSYQLYERMGILLRDKFEDFCGAAEMFSRAAEFPDAPHYMARVAGYAWAQCPGEERRAYEHLRALYEQGEKQHVPSLLRFLGELEEKLGIPMDERIINSSSSASP
jgi:hypothetical protein